MGSSESTLVKIPHCWKSHVVAHIHIPDQFTAPRERERISYAY